MEKIEDICQGDILIFSADDNRYKAIICTSTYKEKSPHNFTFAVTTVDKEEKPSLNEILTSDFYGVGNIKADYFKYSNKEIQKMWNIHPEIEPFQLGSYGLIIWRKDFMKFRDNVELVGSIKIVDNLDKNGNGSINASDWGFLTDFFNEKFKVILPQRDQSAFEVRAITKE